jgi:hypothetical protein
MLSPYVTRSPVVLACLLLLSACGGGGGGGGGNPPPPPPPPPVGSLQFAATSLTIDENAGTASFMVTRTGGSAGPVGATVMTSDGSATVARQDYTAVNETVTFADGDTADKTVTVSINDDNQNESDETLTLTLSAPTGGASLGANTSATVTIRGNDQPPPQGNIQFDTRLIEIEEDRGGVAFFRIRRVGGTTDAVSVTVMTSDGTATAGQDYTAVNQSVNFAAGEDTQSVAVQIMTDQRNEPDETLKLTLSAPTGGAGLGEITESTLRIRNDDPPMGTLQFNTDSLSVDESTGVATILVTRTGGAGGVTSVTVTSSNGTATAGDDYTAVNETVTFGLGQTTPQPVVVAINNDAFGDTGETLTLTLSSPTNGADLGEIRQATLTIDDTDPAGSVQFDPDPPSVNEAAGTAAVTIRLTRVPGSTNAVSVAVASGGGSATAGPDYTAVNTTVDFSVGDDTKIVTVPIINDNVAEADETLNLTLSPPTGGATLGAKTTATLTIQDDDPPTAPDLTITANFKQLVFNWTSVPGATRYVLSLSEDPAGGSAFTQVGPEHGPDETQATFDVAGLHLTDWGNARFRLEACNALGCSPTTMSAMDAAVIAIGYFKASNTQADDLFGQAVALSGDGSTLAVGAEAEDSNATGVGGDQANNDANDSGAVYVFRRSATGWTQQAYVKASNTGSVDQFGDRFGHSVALDEDGSVLAVGAPFEDSNATGVNDPDPDNENAPASGAVYIFTRTGTVWSQQAYVKASNAWPGDQFGISVALNDDGTTLAVGANGEDCDIAGVGAACPPANVGADSSGAAYVFTLGGPIGWQQQAFIKASNTGANDQFGSSLSLSADGNTLAVGALGEGGDGAGNNNNAPKSGAVYVFTRAGAAWSEQKCVKASNPETDDSFGSSLSLSADGSTLAVGAWAEDSSATGIGGDQGNGSPEAGAVYIFTSDGGLWLQQEYVKASNASEVDRFGHSVALSEDGNMLAVGALFEGGGATGVGGEQADNSAPVSGAAYVFTRDGAQQWSQRTYVKASNTEAGDQFGASIALSGDGSALAVGANFEDSNAIEVDGSQDNNAAPSAGAVYMY